MNKTLIVFFSFCIGMTSLAQVAKGADFDKAFNFSTLNTFEWKEQSFKKLGSAGGLEGQELQKLIQDTVSARLKKKKFKKANGGTPDFYLAYHTLGMNPVENAGKLGYKVQQLYFWEKMKIKTSLPEGMLIIDVIDAKSNKLVWRGWGAGPVQKEGQLKKALSKGARKILKPFPPKS